MKGNTLRLALALAAVPYRSSSALFAPYGILLKCHAPPMRNTLGVQRKRRRPWEATTAGMASELEAPPAAAEDSATFTQLYEGRLPEWLLTRLHQLGYECPTLVQRRALGAILAGNDAVIHAQTGSGKTLAFVLPMLAAIDPSRAAVQALIVVPTRELGLQVAAVVKRLSAATVADPRGRILVMSVLEGSANRRQRAWAKAEPPHVVIGNPDNLGALVASGAIRVNAVSYVVVDEVDACLLSVASRNSLNTLLAKRLSPTFATEDVTAVTELNSAAAAALSTAAGGGSALTQQSSNGAQRRKAGRRQTVFASATVPQHRHFLKQCVSNQWTLEEPLHVRVNAEEAMPSSLEHFYVVCSPDKKLAALRGLIKREIGPMSEGEIDGVSVVGGVNKRQALVFGLPTRPLEAIAAALERDLRPASGSKKAAGVITGSDSHSSSESSTSSGSGTSSNDSDTISTAVTKGEPTLPFRARASQYDERERQRRQQRGAPAAEVLREEAGLTNRGDAMAAFRAGEAKVLLATDLAARGLDVPDVSHVVNFDLPADWPAYVHRGGRAGRMGRRGRVISLVAPEEEFVLQRLANAAGVQVTQLVLGGGESSGSGSNRKERGDSDGSSDAEQRGVN